MEPGAPNRKASTTVPGFNSTSDPSQYYGVVYPGQVHAVDFFATPNQPTDRNAAFATGLKMFTAALDEWLPNFQSGSDVTITAPTGTVTGTAAVASASASGKSKGNNNGAVIVVGHSVVLVCAALLISAVTW